MGCSLHVHASYMYPRRRFLDPHRMLNLITYLEKLFEKGLATKVANYTLSTRHVQCNVCKAVSVDEYPTNPNTVSRLLK